MLAPAVVFLFALAVQAELQHFPLRSHRQQLRVKHRRLAGGNSTADAELFQGIGTHYVDLYIGTPNGQPQTLIVDTGSEWTAFPCVSNCCGQHTDEAFDRQQSETYEALSCSDGCIQQHACPATGDDTCHVHMMYAEGSSWSAIEAVDQVSLSELGSPSFPLRFGCQTKTTRLFRTQLADGIMGLDDGPLSMWRQAGADSFSLCFSAADQLEDGAGVLTLGGYDDRLLLDDMQWAKRTSQNRDNWYHVEVTSIFFQTGDDSKTTVEGFDSDAINAGGVILDSGTTDTYLASILERGFREAFHTLTGHKWSNNLKLSLEQLQELPTLVVQLQSIQDADPVLVQVPPLHYFEEESNGMFQPSLFFEGSQSTLGANFLRGHNVHFAADKIGFGRSRCLFQDVAQEQSSAQSHSIKIETPQAGEAGTGQEGLGIGLMLMAVVGAIGGALVVKQSKKKQNYRVLKPEHTLPEIELS